MKKLLSIGVLLPAITVVMASVLVANFSIVALGAYDRRQEAAQSIVVVDVTRDLLNAMINLRQEFGGVAGALRNGETNGVNTPDRIAMLRREADAAFDSAIARLDETGSDLRSLREKFLAARSEVARMRGVVDTAMENNSHSDALEQQWQTTMTNLMLAAEDISHALANRVGSQDPYSARMFKFAELSWMARNNAGTIRLVVANALFDKALPPSEMPSLAAIAGSVDALWILIAREASAAPIPASLERAFEEAKAEDQRIRDLYRRVAADLTAGRTPEMTSPQWVAFTERGMAANFSFTSAALDLTAARAHAVLDAARRNLYLAIAGVLLFVALGVAATWIVMFRIVRPIQTLARAMTTVAHGTLTENIPYERRGDEIGDLAKSLRIFARNEAENQRLQVATEVAERSNRAKSEFLATMSHELRTPLNAIIGFSEMIKSEILGPVGVARYRDYCTHIYNSGVHLLDIINDILDISRFESGNFKLDLTAVDVSPTVGECVKLMTPVAERAQVVLTASLMNGLPLLNSDARRLRQIVLNLLSNGIKFTPAGGSVDVTVARDHGGLYIRVADTGIGIAAKDIPVALERFGQIDSKISRKYEGTGIGLPLSKRLVETLGGTLAIDSRVGEGTMVTVYFPTECEVGRSRAA